MPQARDQLSCFQSEGLARALSTRHNLTMDYYDYGPRVTLERPVLLVGFMGARVSHTGHALSSVLGLPYVELDRRIEHRAGMSLAQLQLTRGERERRDLEAALLVDAVEERPAGIIAVGDGALLRTDTLDVAVARTRLVYLERPAAHLFQTIDRQLQDQPARYPELVFAQRKAPERALLQALLDERLPGYRAAHVSIDAADLHPTKVSELVRAELGLSVTQH